MYTKNDKTVRWTPQSTTDGSYYDHDDRAVGALCTQTKKADGSSSLATPCGNLSLVFAEFVIEEDLAKFDLDGIQIKRFALRYDDPDEMTNLFEAWKMDEQEGITARQKGCVADIPVYHPETCHGTIARLEQRGVIEVAAVRPRDASMARTHRACMLTLSNHPAQARCLAHTHTRLEYTHSRKHATTRARTPARA